MTSALPAGDMDEDAMTMSELASYRRAQLVAAEAAYVRHLRIVDQHRTALAAAEAELAKSRDRLDVTRWTVNRMLASVAFGPARA